MSYFVHVSVCVLQWPICVNHIPYSLMANLHILLQTWQYLQPIWTDKSGQIETMLISSQGLHTTGQSNLFYFHGNITGYPLLSWRGENIFDWKDYLLKLKWEVIITFVSICNTNETNLWLSMELKINRWAKLSINAFDFLIQLANIIVRIYFLRLAFAQGGK